MRVWRAPVIARPVLARLLLQRICVGQLVGVSDDDLPGVVLKSVDLGAAEYAVIRASVTGSLHVLEVHRARQVFADHSEEVLDRALAGADPAARPIQALGDIVPAALKSTERTHDRYVVGMRPQPLERFGAALHELAERRLAVRTRLFPRLPHLDPPVDRLAPKSNTSATLARQA